MSHISEITEIAEYLIDHVTEMKKHAEAVMAYCTEECSECPIRGFCDWDKHIDSYDEGLTSIERMADFVEYARKYDEKQENANAWENANRWAGVDPHWY